MGKASSGGRHRAPESTPETEEEAEILSNDFTERVGSVVDDIEATMPDIVGLQEAVEFRHMDAGGETTIDFVQILEDVIAARGLPYNRVWIQDNTVVPVPLNGVVIGAEFIPTEVVQPTERLAVLVRDDFGPVSVSQGNFDETIPPLTHKKSAWRSSWRRSPLGWAG